MRRAVYAGSFDPLTTGHLWMIEQGALLFDELIVAIGVNPEKRYYLTLDERLTVLRASTTRFPNARIASFENQFLVRYARSVEAPYIIRGIRTEADFEYERVMRQMNSDLDPGVVTVFLMPPREIAEVSSSLVRGLVGPQGWQEVVRKFVPPPVYQLLLKKHGDVR